MSIGMFSLAVFVSGYIAFTVMGFTTSLTVHKRVNAVFAKSLETKDKKIFWNGYEKPKKFGWLARNAFYPLVMLFINLLIVYPLTGAMNAFVDTYRTIYFDSCLKAICLLNDIELEDLDQSVVKSEKALL